jgi:hypothetical protein
MPKGPKGEKRPADVIGNAVHVMRIATGEIEESYEPARGTRADAGHKGGKARARSMSPNEVEAAAAKPAKCGPYTAAA